MTRDVTPTARECCWRDNATFHLLGALPLTEAQAYEAHLAACGACAEELELARKVVARVDASVVESSVSGALPAGLEPDVSARVREKLLEAVGRTPRDLDANGSCVEPEPFQRMWRSWSAVAREKRSGDDALTPGLRSISADEGVWEPIGIPGIEVKRLAVDAPRRVVSMLVRMAAGSSYPGHRHAGDEECYVVSGDISVGDRILRAGDYQLAAAGSVHGVQSTKNGCTLFISSSQDDELV